MLPDIGVRRHSMGPFPQKNHTRHRDSAKSCCKIYIWPQGLWQCQWSSIGTRLTDCKSNAKNHRLTLLTRILQAEDMHSALSSAYEEVVDDHIITITIRSAALGELSSISINSRCCHQSFLPRTILEMRGLTSNNQLNCLLITAIMLKTLDQKKLHIVILLRHYSNAEGGQECSTLSQVNQR